MEWDFGSFMKKFLSSKMFETPMNFRFFDFKDSMF